MAEKPHRADIEAKINAIREEIKQRFLSEVSKLRCSLFSRMNESSRDVTTNDQSFRSTAVSDASGYGDPETLADRELQARQAKLKEIEAAKRVADSTVGLLQQELNILERIMVNVMEQSLFEGNLKALLLGLNGIDDKTVIEKTVSDNVRELRPQTDALPKVDFNANLGASVSDINSALKKRIAPGN